MRSALVEAVDIRNLMTLARRYFQLLDGQRELDLALSSPDKKTTIHNCEIRDMARAVSYLLTVNGKTQIVKVTIARGEPQPIDLQGIRPRVVLVDLQEQRMSPEKAFPETDKQETSVELQPSECKGQISEEVGKIIKDKFLGILNGRFAVIPLDDEA